jgi:hypothetical protein
MGDVIDFRRKTKASDKEKADLYYQLLKTCKMYILKAQEAGVYDGWKNDGNAIVDFIDRIRGI